jgi:hypothetical protein
MFRKRAFWVSAAVILGGLLLMGTGCGEKGSLDREITSARETERFDAVGIVADWTAMWNSYDLAQVDDLFLADSRLSYFSSEKEGVIEGIEAVREHHKGFGFVPGGKKPDSRLWVEDIRAEVFGRTAVVTGIWFFEKKTAGIAETQRGPLTFVYVLEEGKFRLAHLNFAEYFDTK